MPRQVYPVASMAAFRLTSSTASSVRKEASPLLRAAETFLAAGMALALFLFWLLLAPVEVYGEWAVPSKLPEIGLRLILFFLSGALWATVGLLFSGLTQNIYLAYAAPFILYYVLIILQERYFRAAFMLNPQNYLTMEGAWPLAGKSAALTLLSLVILFQLLFCRYMESYNLDNIN